MTEFTDRFTDDAGIVWQMILDEAAIARIKHKTGLDFKDRPWDAFIEMTGTQLFRTLYEACATQAEHVGITANQFCATLKNSLEQAMRAFFEALVITKPRRERPELRRIWMSKMQNQT